MNKTARFWWIAAAVVWSIVGIRAANAQVQMDDGGPCYTWQGGNYSAGAFTRCPQPWVVQAKRQPPVALPTPAIAPSPIMMPMSCPPMPKPNHRIVKKKPAPAKC
jgi:hypothetical protein